MDSPFFQARRRRGVAHACAIIKIKEVWSGDKSRELVQEENGF